MAALLNQQQMRPHAKPQNPLQLCSAHGDFPVDWADLMCRTRKPTAIRAQLHPRGYQRLLPCYHRDNHVHAMSIGISPRRRQAAFRRKYSGVSQTGLCSGQLPTGNRHVLMRSSTALCVSGYKSCVPVIKPMARLGSCVLVDVHRSCYCTLLHSPLLWDLFEGAQRQRDRGNNIHDTTKGLAMSLTLVSKTNVLLQGKDAVFGNCCLQGKPRQCVVPTCALL